MIVTPPLRSPLLPALLLVALAHVACSTSCDNTEDGPAQAISADSNSAPDVYESSPWNSEWLRFKPQKRYRFLHGLEGVPTLLQAWVGFDPNPLAGHSASEGVGNIAVWECVNERFVQLRNDTCETFYLRVTAANPVPPDEMPDDAANAASASRDGACADE